MKAFSDALGFEKPVVYGGSLGGFVAQAYATRHPDHPGRLVLVSTAAKVHFDTVFEAFERIGGPEAREVAETYWLDPTPERRARYLEVCLPLYRARPSGDGDARRRAVVKNDVAMHFNGPANEHGRIDFRDALRGVRCPVLVTSGDRDPVTPTAFSEVIAACLPPHRVRYERFAGCGHGVVPDDPGRAYVVLRGFIAGGA